MFCLSGGDHCVGFQVFIHSHGSLGACNNKITTMTNTRFFLKQISNATLNHTCRDTGFMMYTIGPKLLGE